MRQQMLRDEEAVEFVRRGEYSLL
ncbi:MAG: hypothetical protein JSW00_18150 [Thermoplasmata archaeon]|nr:MAG: hypothetical protein JSW00_18150 [Thermoplasmata archaeon]